MRRLFIHAGPPKTATTSLQILLGEIKIPRTIFIGVFQPRVEMNARGLNMLGNKIIRYIRGENDRKRKEEIQREILHIFSEYDNIIYSEEMILHTEKWRSNVDRAFELFGDFDVTLAYCLRDARRAVPSYYCESYSGLQKTYRENYQRFLQTEWSGIYDLANVFAQLRRSGFKKINPFYFEELVAGKLSLSEIFDAEFDDPAWQTPLIPPLANKKSLSSDGEQTSAGEWYTVVLDNYRTLPSGIRKVLGRLNSVGLGGIAASIRHRMVERRELFVEPSPFLEELFHRNASMMRDSKIVELGR